MDFGDFKITPREVLVCIAATLILLGLGYLITTGVRKHIEEKNEVYYKALKIKDDNDMFQYALDTNIGYVLAQGHIKAVNGVSDSGIDGIYFRIRKVKEKYTKHTKRVAHTRTKSDGTTETYYTTETYWEWDYQGTETTTTEKFDFMGVEYSYGKINFSNEEYLGIVKESSKIRYKYYVIPFEFDGTLFSFIENNTITKNEFYFSNIDKVIEDKQNASSTFKIIFWTIWIFLILLADFFYVYADNKYLED